MSRYKFRAWDEQCKEMHYNFQWIDSGIEGNDWIVFKSDRQKLSEKPHPFENPYFRQQYKIMQWTGLTDKNGVDIYEGDIVKETCNYTIVENGKPTFGIKETVLPVEFDNNLYGWKPFVNNPDNEYEGVVLLAACEVIGNIHQGVKE